MKKILILLFCIFAFSSSAEVKPFFYENIASDSVSQQAEFDYMLKYKLFGRDYIKIGNDVEIPDRSGWNGTSGDFSSGPRLVLGGPILVSGDIKASDQQSMTTGPIRGNSFTMGNDNGSVLTGRICLSDSNVTDNVKNIITRSGGVLAASSSTECSEVPEAPANLTIPVIVWPDTMTRSIVFEGNNDVKRIIVPDGEYEDAYDIYLNDITYTMNEQKLVIQMQEGGRLTRLFVKNFAYHDHGEIQVEYRSAEGNRLLDVKEYRGNVLIYTNNDISISNSDNRIMEGTIISTGKIYLACNINLAGQLIANQLEIGNTYHGENFIFMPFDEKVIDIDPEINKNGGLRENDSTVAFPIKLSDTATVDVYFSYCFELSENVVREDFNTVGLKFPVCGIDTPEQAVIKAGETYPSDTIKVNVKKDDLVELEDTLVIRIIIESGAVLPGDKTEGILKIKITDSEYKNQAPSLDKTQKLDPYEEEQLIPPCTGEIGKITVKDEYPDKLVFEIVDSTGMFAIDDKGVITTWHVFDYETEDTVYTVKVKVTDAEGLADSADYVIKIKNKQEGISASIDLTPVYEGSVDSIGGVVIGIVTGKDADSTKVSYKLTDTTNTFVIDSTGSITIIGDIDYEKQNKYTVTVTMSSTDGSKKDTAFVITVLNVNEPVHVKDTTFTVPENSTGPIGKVDAWDEDGDKITYWVSDSAKYSIDTNGVITVKDPFDFETTTKDSVIVYVCDPSGLTDSAVIHINVLDEKESTNVVILHVDTRDSVYNGTNNPIFTNDKTIEITYKADEKHKDTTITDLKEGKNVIEICDIGVGKDTKACDTVTIWYSDKTPVITVAAIDKTKETANNITIIDEPDGNQYVNNKNPEIKVTVKDPANSKKDTTFIISANLKSVDVPVKSLVNKTVEPPNDISSLSGLDYKTEVIGKDSVLLSYYDPVNKVIVSYVTNSDLERLSEEFTVSWVEKVNGQDVTISYTTDSYVEVKSNYSISYSVPQGKDTITVSYQVDSDGKIQNTNGNVGYTISYSYTNEYGNTGKSEIQIVLDDIPPKVEIYKIIAGKDTIYPGNAKNWGEYVAVSAITVFWTVDGVDQDTLNLQGLIAEAPNSVVRCYQDKANNQTCDTVMIYAKGVKDIEIKMAYPVTEIVQDRVDSFYAAGGKYDHKNPIQIIAQDASEDKLPEPIGVGIKIGLALPILNQNGGMPTADDIVQTIDGVTGIVIDGRGNVVTDAIAEIRDNSTKIISVDNYIENYCTDQYKEEVRKNGIEKVPFYDMKYSMRVWIFTNNANYVNDFNFEYTVDENQKVDAAGILNIMVDWLAAKDGYVKAGNGKAIGTGAYLAKLEANSVSTAKCTLNKNEPKGTKIKKTEYDLISFGYKRLEKH